MPDEWPKEPCDLFEKVTCDPFKLGAEFRFALGNLPWSKKLSAGERSELEKTANLIKEYLDYDAR